MGKFSKWNKGIRYLLMVIDVFSKFGWIRPLKDKRGQTVADAFRSIFRERAARKPKMLWSDKGSEFFNAIMKDLLSKNGIKLYTTENEEKSSVVERWNRTMKEKLFRMFSANNNTIYWDKLDKLVDQYNHRFHSSIRMTQQRRANRKMRKRFSLIFSAIYFMLNATKQNSKLATKSEFQSLNARYLTKVSPRTGQRKYLLSTKY